MKRPIITHGEDGFYIFESADIAELYIEPIDVGEIDVVYDSEGRVLEAVVVEDSSGIEYTKIRDDGNGVFKEPELRMLLIRFLEHFSSSPADLESLSLRELVAESLKHRTE